ncbi:leucine-rich repeat domain-containing protein [Lacibacter luteus]|uniref:Leucine-rich repeat domain-containing protein n=1 Tax=Lacibacter luteus TaxID=2508719 RepID=A0A4Q1CKN7_9BACT|nr:leucine-rich repeat domain-containing protein [Lacibacter luteus]RXK60948.1 leucine-rich repeat domain-containing protein [Lacibacter luteus]
MSSSLQHWWRQLEPQWQQAFSITAFQHTNEPTPDELAQLYATPALRFAGPSAPYPNMNFELTNLSGVEALQNLETLVVIFQKIETVKEVSRLKSLKHLFLYSNQVNSLNGIEALTALEMLYVQDNQISSFQQVEKLINLRELYINGNKIENLNGLTEEHAEKLQMFFCKPNDLLKQKEMLRVERELGIRCRSI